MQNNPIELYRSLVMLEGDEMCTTSRLVAQRFNKTNRHVMGNIDRMMVMMNSHRPKMGSEMFRETLYKDSRGKMQREFVMTQQGFMLLAMRFTGEEAFKWQLQFVDAFNWLLAQMEEREENNRLMAQFDIKNRASIADGSYHGAGLQRRKVEKIVLGIEEIIIKSKVQRSISFGKNANEADASVLPN